MHEPTTPAATSDPPSHVHAPAQPLAPAGRRAKWTIPLAIASGVALFGALTFVLFLRSPSRVHHQALADRPKGVTVIRAQAAPYRPSRRYVGTVAPWLEARVGPQFTSAYVDTVLVRPGQAAKRGQVLATLDCKSASAQSKAMQLQARALSTTQEAMANEAGRLSGLLQGGYVSPNEVERRTAESASKQAELLAQNARLVRASLEVDDCVLHAPFDGEVAERLLDPGGFARPGAPILTLVDRRQVRVLIDVPESDFSVVAEGTPARLRLVALGRRLTGRIARRAPAADVGTRTIHAEIDLSATDPSIPVGTTVEVDIDMGDPVPAIEIPLRAAAVRGEAATLFEVKDGIAKKHKIAVLGESAGSLFVAAVLAPFSQVVSEGRALLKDGDRVDAKAESALSSPAGSPPAPTSVAVPAQAGGGQP